jgi:hypothetical protein
MVILGGACGGEDAPRFYPAPGESSRVYLLKVELEHEKKECDEREQDAQHVSLKVEWGAMNYVSRITADQLRLVNCHSESAPECPQTLTKGIVHFAMTKRRNLRISGC